MKTQKWAVLPPKTIEKYQKMHFFEEKSKKVAEKFGGTEK